MGGQGNRIEVAATPACRCTTGTIADAVLRVRETVRGVGPKLLFEFAVPTAQPERRSAAHDLREVYLKAARWTLAPHAGVERCIEPLDEAKGIPARSRTPCSRAYRTSRHQTRPVERRREVSTC